MTKTQDVKKNSGMALGCGITCGSLFAFFALYSLLTWSMGIINLRLILSAVAVLLLAVALGKVVQRLTDRLAKGDGYRHN